MSKHIDEYIKLCRDQGPLEFSRTQGTAVLVGLGVVGTLAEDGARGGAQTFLASLDMHAQETKSLHRRIWRVEKARFGPETKNVRLGRSSENDIIIPEYSISQTHCEFSRTSEGEHRLLDLGAHNGTLINGVKLQPHALTPLESEDEVVIGRYLFEFLDSRTFTTRVAVMAGFQP